MVDRGELRAQSFAAEVTAAVAEKVVAALAYEPIVASGEEILATDLTG